MKKGDVVVILNSGHMEQVYAGEDLPRGTIVEAVKMPSGFVVASAKTTDGRVIHNDPYVGCSFVSEDFYAGMLRDEMERHKKEIARLEEELKMLERQVKKLSSDKWVVKGVNGSCIWTIDEDGVLMIAPANGYKGYLDSPGMFPDCQSPWVEHAAMIKRVVARPGVSVTPSADFMFGGLPYCESMDLSSLDTAKMASASHMFHGDKALKTVDISMWDIHNLRDVQHMFDGCRSLTELKTFDVHSIYRHHGVYFGCPTGCGQER